MKHVRFSNMIIMTVIFAIMIVCISACSDKETVTPTEAHSTSTTAEDKETTKELVVTTEAVATSGSCGDNATWRFDEISKTLIIDGTGEVKKNWKQWRSSIEKVIIGDGITGIGHDTFNNCESLNEITIPDSVNEIGDNAFYDSGLYNNPENWTNGVLYVDGHAVDAKESLSGNVILKKDTRSIASFAFAFCPKITSVTIPDSVKNIGSFAFAQCEKLESVSIGKGTETIADNLFEDPYAGCEIIICSSLKDISVDEENLFFTTENGVLYSKDKTELIKLPTLYSQKSFILPENVTLIRPFAFFFCTTLEKLIMNNYNITSLEGVYFSGCEKLETVILPDSLINLGEETFKFSGIKSIVIPDKVVRIGQETFAFCENLKTVTLGKGVSEIDGSAFNVCFGLEQINAVSGNVTFSSENGVLFNKGKTELILYPYAKAGEQYNIPESVNIIREDAFNGSKNLKKLFIGKNIKTIESYNCFYGKLIEADYAEDEPYEYLSYDIYYEGTQTQWNQINASNDTFDDIESPVHFNSSRLPELETATAATTPKAEETTTQKQQETTAHKEETKRNIFFWF